MTAFNFNAVRFNSATVALGGIRSPNFQRREVLAPIGTDGTLHQTSNAVLRAAPMCSFETIAVRALITALNGSSDLYMKAFDGTNGLQMIGLKINSTGPGYDSTAVHASRLMARGQLYLSGLSWSPGDALVASCDAYGISADGTTDPVAVDAALALPTLAVNTEQLAMSSLVIGGLTVTRVKSWSLTIAHGCENNDEALCYSTGLPYPMLLRQAGVGGQTEITMTVETLDLSGSITASGTGVAVFKTVNPLGVGLSSSTTTVTVRSALIREEQIEGAPAGRRITVHGTYDGANLPLAIANA